MAANNLELYVHIPFCVKKCLYCDFLSAPEKDGELSDYMESLGREIEGCERDEAQIGNRPVTSIFIGGGTPSLLTAGQAGRLLKQIRERFFVTEEAEITIEANPGTVDFDKLSGYREAGINRLSIGLQSAREEELRQLGRIHSYAQFQETFENARRAGFGNINVDVMSALPGQTLSSYQDTLFRVLALSPEHISAYSLMIEEGTPFWNLEKEGKLKLPDEDTERAMYRETKRLLEAAGYHRYEISNYAKNGFECRHNCGYWERVDYLGFGIGAASLLENVRFQNGAKLQEYLKNPLSVRSEAHRLSLEEQMEEFMFLGLRLTKGISPKRFYELFGRSVTEVYGPVIEKNIKDGLLWRSASKAPDGALEARRKKNAAGVWEERLCLTERGTDLSNYCMAQFLLD